MDTPSVRFCDDAQEAVAALLPPGVAVRATRRLLEPAAARASLADVERAAVARAVPARVQEFATGRACARRAVVALGHRPTAIPPGPDRAPQWPCGVVGSITHCTGLCAAAVAPADLLAGLGIDAEVNAALPSGVEDLILLPAERDRVGRRPARVGIAWDVLVFSAKEAVFKAVHPIDGHWRDFRDFSVTLHEDGSFDARSVTDVPLGPMAGRWRSWDDVVMTTAWVLAPPR